MRGKALRLLAALTLGAGVLLVGGSAPASAAMVTSVCDDTPVPGSPYNGLSAAIMGAPDPIPAHADPFVPGSPTTIFEQYGMGGLQYETYDSGCVTGGGEAKANVLSSFADVVSLNGQIPLAVTASIGNATLNPTWLGFLDTPILSVSQSLNEAVVQPWGFTFFLLAAVLTVIAITRLRLSKALTTVMFGLVGLTVVAIGVNWPVQSAHILDETMATGSVSIVSAIQAKNDTHPVTEETKAQPGTRMVSGLYEVVAYDRWVAGTLGSAESPTARKYGPALFKAHALHVGRGPGRGGGPRRQGRRHHQSPQGRVGACRRAGQERRPPAYEFLKGNHAGSRIGEAFTGMLIAAIVLPFLFGSFLVILLSFAPVPAAGDVRVSHRDPAGAAQVTAAAGRWSGRCSPRRS